jgi:hypothetical protein
MTRIKIDRGMIEAIAAACMERLQVAAQVALAAGLESVLGDLDEIAIEAQTRTSRARSRARQLKENPPAKRRSRAR